MMEMHLIIPMGGAGSRFFKNGYELPKPLIEISGKPFLYWATQSILKFIKVKSLTFVVLEQHIKEFKIDKVIKQYYPFAYIEVIKEVLPGPVLTCLEGIKNIDDDLPIIFNDCDHMFQCNSFNELINMGEKINFDGALLTFVSNMPQFSYIEYDSNNVIIGTIEKKVVSNHAICGAYTFKNAKLFREVCKEYMNTCNYSEFFMSGVYNVMCKHGMKVIDYVVDFHVSFGTPSEYELAKDSEYYKLLI